MLPHLMTLLGEKTRKPNGVYFGSTSATTERRRWKHPGRGSYPHPGVYPKDAFRHQELQMKTQQKQRGVCAVAGNFDDPDGRQELFSDEALRKKMAGRAIFSPQQIHHGAGVPDRILLSATAPGANERSKTGPGQRVRTQAISETSFGTSPRDGCLSPQIWPQQQNVLTDFLKQAFTRNRPFTIPFHPL
jgi:hypothetical protein